MADLSIAVLNGQNEVECHADGVDELWLVHQRNADQPLPVPVLTQIEMFGRNSQE